MVLRTVLAAPLRHVAAVLAEPYAALPGLPVSVDTETMVRYGASATPRERRWRRARVTAASFLLALAAAAARPQAAAPSSAPQPPQLLGVWYGVYEAPDAPVRRVEMWVEIASQASIDGWEIAGHDRWNVLHDEARPHGSESLGSAAENFDSFTGRIAPDGHSVMWTEDHGEGSVTARVLGDDALEATLQPRGAAAASVTVRLERVDTGYTPGGSVVQGIDVSHHSGAVDWRRVRDAGYRFAYVKASEGVDAADAMFATHWQALRELGMPRGAYHFYVTEDDPVAQAKFFASRLREDRGTLPPAVDVELLGAHTTGDMTATLRRFLTALEEELGVRPLLYTAADFWDAHYRPELADYPLWMAEYGVQMPRVPFGWTRWLLWQRAGDRAVPGVEKSADVSILHPSADLAALRAAGEVR